MRTGLTIRGSGGLGYATAQHPVESSAPTRPIRFLHLSTFYPPWSFGGDAVYVHRLAGALADEGHEVDVVHCRDAYHLLHPGAPEQGVAAHPGVRVHHLGSPLRALSPLVTHQTGRPGLKSPALGRIVNSRPFDVMHFHNVSLLGPRVLALRPAEAKPLKLYTAHEHWLVCPTHVLWKFGRELCEEPACVRCTLRARRPPQLWRHTGLLAECCRHVDQFIALSRSSAQVHADRGFTTPMACLPCFIDRADTDWQRPGPPPQDRPYCLFVGRLEAIKGLQTLIRVWDRVPDFDLLVAGSGAFETELRAQAAGNPRIRFLGHVPQASLGPLYFHAVACLVPSLTYETFGIIVIEAFMRKTPVIAHDLGALTDIVHDSGGGLLYRTDEQLLRAIGDIGRSPARRTELGERGYAAFLSQWSREAHLRQYYALLQRTARRVLGRVPWES